MAVAIATILLTSNFTIINAQSQQFTSPAGVIENKAATTTIQSMNDSLRVQVPSEWIIQDIDNVGPAQLEEGRQGYGILMQLCPEEQAAAAAPVSTIASGVGSINTISSINASRCLGAQEVIHIIRYPDLDTGLSANNGLTTTIDNALTYHLQKLQDVGYRSMLLVNSTDTTVNIINPQTNQTLTTVPARLVEMTYSTNFAPNEMKRGYFILTAANETVPNVGTTKGYGVFYEGNSIGTGITATTSASSSLQPTPLPTAVKQTFDSFELIAAPEATQSVVQTEQTGQGGGSEVGQLAQSDCDPSYPDVCIASPPPNLNCDDVGFLSFRVLSPDPHGFDGDNDGIGCESQGDSENGDGNVVGDGDEEEDNSCHPSYPDVCIPPPPPNLNCDDIDARNFEVSGSDPHGFDGNDNDGIGCESGSNDSDNDEDNGADDDDSNNEDDNGGDGEPTPEPEPEPGDSEGDGGDGGEEGEGDGGNNPNEFEDCEVVGGGEDVGDIGC